LKVIPIQTAGISIMNNIAEGFERKSSKEFSRFLDISKGSCGEVRSMYYSAEDLQYISPEVAQNRRERAKHISGGISGSLRLCWNDYHFFTRQFFFFDGR